MALSKEAKNHILRIFKKETNVGKGVSIERFTNGKIGPVRQGDSVSIGSIDKVDGTKEEISDFLHELKNKSIIRPINDLNPNSFCFTAKGKAWAESKTFDVEQDYFKLDNVVSDSELIEKVKPLFEDGHYESAIPRAFVCIEERIRYKSGADENYYGVKLIDFALNPDEGKLIHPLCKTKVEKQGLHLLFRGSYQFFKNPRGHREVGWDNPKSTGQIISFADLLLKILNETKIR